MPEELMHFLFCDVRSLALVGFPPSCRGESAPQCDCHWPSSSRVFDVALYDRVTKGFGLVVRTALLLIHVPVFFEDACLFTLHFSVPILLFDRRQLHVAV